MKSILERFEDKFIPEPNSGCWLWVGGGTHNGYGSFWGKGKLERAHRVSYKLYNGHIPEGLHVLHKCDTPSCVNPDHLFTGTQADNIADKMAKGRQTKGEKTGSAKLTENQVLEIRQGDRSQADLASSFGVSQSNIWAVVHRKTWRHI